MYCCWKRYRQRAGRFSLFAAEYAKRTQCWRCEPCKRS